MRPFASTALTSSPPFFSRVKIKNKIVILYYNTYTNVIDNDKISMTGLVLQANCSDVREISMHTRNFHRKKIGPDVGENNERGGRDGERKSAWEFFFRNSQ